jgi:hypothetical protein
MHLSLLSSLRPLRSGKKTRQIIAEAALWLAQADKVLGSAVMASASPRSAPRPAASWCLALRGSCRAKSLTASGLMAATWVSARRLPLAAFDGRTGAFFAQRRRCAGPPAAHGPDGIRPSATARNKAASGQLVGSWMRMRAMCRRELLPEPGVPGRPRPPRRATIIVRPPPAKPLPALTRGSPVLTLGFAFCHRSSSTSLRTATHGLGPMWFATTSSCRTFTDYSLPVSRRTSNPIWPATQSVSGAGFPDAFPTLRKGCAEPMFRPRY